MTNSLAIENNMQVIKFSVSFYGTGGEVLDLRGGAYSEAPPFKKRQQ